MKSFKELYNEEIQASIGAGEDSIARTPSRIGDKKKKLVKKVIPKGYKETDE